MNMKSIVNVIRKTDRSIIFLEYFPRYCVSRTHTHKIKETLHITKGKGMISCQDIDYELEKGMIFVVDPFKEHQVCTGNEKLELLSVIEGNDTKEIMDIYWGFMKINQ